jgi:phosphoglycerate dehydrogenase-like enzyme
VKIIVDDANLLPHRSRLEAAVPPGSQVSWHVGGVPQLRLIHPAAAGTEKADFGALAPGVLVANTFHHERSIAEYVVAAAVMLRRDFLTQDRQLRRNMWATSVYDASIPQSSTLGDAHIGFVGFGHIGRYTWNLFRAFGCTGRR